MNLHEESSSPLRYIGQEVRLIRFDGAFRYAAGDVAAVAPRNNEAVVRRFLALCSDRALPPDEWRQAEDLADVAFRFEPREDSARSPRGEPEVSPTSRTTLRELAERFLDLTSPPSQPALTRLSVFADNNDERTKLLELATPQGAALYDEYAVQERRSLVEVLEEFRSVTKVPLARLLDEFDTIKERQFSIASAPDHHHHHRAGGTSATSSLKEEEEVQASSFLELCVARVAYETPLGRQRDGLCSAWLCDLPEGATISLRVLPGSFVGLKNVKNRNDSPLVLVGPGTGVAPMRSILRSRRLGASSPQKDVLFFGCRRKDSDFLFADEWENESDDRVDVVLACSRDPDASRRAYVTQRLREEHARVLDLIFDRDGLFLVAGNVRMATDVRHVFLDLLQQHAGLDAKQANATLAKLERDGRFATEAYG